MATSKTAIVVAASLEVHCPHCGDAQPNPWDESHLWTPTQVTSLAGPGGVRRVCNACDEPFAIVAQSRVNVLESQMLTAEIINEREGARLAASQADAIDVALRALGTSRELKVPT